MVFSPAQSRCELTPRLRGQEFNRRREFPYLLVLGLLIFLANLPLIFQRTYQNLSAFMIDYPIGVLYCFNGLGENLRQGYFFLWGPEMGCGIPVLAYYLSGLAYPLSQLFSLISYPTNIISFYLIHFELLGIFSYLVFRRLGISRPASLLASGWNALSGYTIWVSMVPSVIAPLPWFYLIVYLLLTPSKLFRLTNFVLLIIGFSLMLLAGDPEEVVYAGYFGGLWLVLYWLFAKNSFSKKTVFLLGMGLLLSVMLSLDQLLPTLNFLARGTRSSKPSYQVYLESFLSLKMVWDGFWGLFSRKYLNFFFSFFALGFAFWAVVRNRQAPAVRASVIVILVLVLLLILPKIGLGKIPYHLPLFSHFVRHYKLGYLFQFLLLVLAGFGLDQFLERLEADSRSRKKSILLFLSLTIVGFILADFNLFLLLPLIPAVLLGRCNRFRESPALVMGLILMLDVFPYLWHPPYPFFKFDPPKYWAEYEKIAKSSEGKYRIQVFYPGIYFLSQQVKIPLPFQIAGAPGGETFDFYMTFPLRDYTEFLALINPGIKKPPTDFSMIFNWPLLFKSQDYLSSENRYLLNLLGLRWLFLYQFALKETDQRNLIYDPAHFLNLKLGLRSAYGRYQLGEFTQGERKRIGLKSKFSADFYYSSDFTFGDEIDFHLSAGKDPVWFLLTAQNQDETRLVFARMKKSVSASELFSAKIPIPSQKLGLLMLKSGEEPAGWIAPMIRNPRKPIKYRSGDEPALFENPEALPRGFVVHQAQVFKDREQILKALADPSRFNPLETVLLLEGGEEFREDLTSANFGQEEVELKEYMRERIVLRVKAEGKGLLVWTDQYYPGWQAFVDGKEQRILRANLCFRGLRLSEGEHEIIFQFQPMDFRLGLYVKIISVFFLAGIAFFAVFQRIRSSS